MLDKIVPIVVLSILWIFVFSFIAVSSVDIHHLISLSILFFITLVLFFILFSSYRSQRGIQEKLRKLHVFSSIVGEFTDVAVFDEQGRAVYTTHPHIYPNQKEFLRKTLLKVEASQEASTFKKWIEEHHSGELILSGGGNGLGEKQKKWLARIRNVNPTLTNGQNYVLVVLTDLTAYLDGVKKLREHYSQLECFLDRAPFALFYLNKSGHIVGANETFCEWLNVKKEILVGEKINVYIDDFSPSLTSKILVITPYQKKSFKVVYFPPEEDSHQAIILCKFDKDILNLPSSNQNIASENSFISSRIPSIVINKSGSILSMNPAFGSLIADTIVIDDKIKKTDQSIYDLLDNATVKETKEKIKQVFTSKEKVSLIEMVLGVNKHPMMTYISVIDDFLESSKETQLILQFIDISEQKRLEQQFSQSQKMQAVGQLAGGIAHDFNNLLTAMIGFCDLLLQRYLPNDPSYMDVMQIKQNANRAANLVRQLLAFSRQQSLQPRVIDITDILSELSALMRRLIGVNIELNLIHGRDLSPIKADVSQLEQVMINLVVNARDAMPNGGTLTIRTKNYFCEKQTSIGHEVMPKGDYVAIEVEDTGTGIPSEIMDRIFEPFFSTKEISAGTGLGLSTVYGIIKQSNAFILVESVLNKGTCFKLFFPRSVEPISKLQIIEETPTHAFSTGGTILLVEDEDAVRMFAARSLREKGYKVIEAENGEDALSLVKSGEKFDLLVTDVVMPKMDGPTLNKRIRDIYPQTKTIFISGYAEDTFRKNLGLNAQIHFLSKPFSLKDLISKVHEVLS